MQHHDTNIPLITPPIHPSTPPGVIRNSLSALKPGLPACLPFPSALGLCGNDDDGNKVTDVAVP